MAAQAAAMICGVRGVNSDRRQIARMTCRNFGLGLSATMVEAITMTERYTKAVLARQVSRAARLLVSVQADLAFGMWNPDFCASDATVEALSICEDLQMHINQIRERCSDLGEEPSR